MVALPAALGFSNTIASPPYSTSRGTYLATDAPLADPHDVPLQVDDDPLCLKVIEQMLKRCNYEGTLLPPYARSTLHEASHGLTRTH